MKTLEDLRKILIPTGQQNYDNVCTVNYDKITGLLLLELIERIDRLNTEVEYMRSENRINLEYLNQTLIRKGSKS